MRDTLAPAAPGDPDRHAEVGWATLHGLATLARTGRLPHDGARAGSHTPSTCSSRSPRSADDPAVLPS